KMINEFITPVSEELRDLAAGLDLFSIGNSIRFDQEIEPNSIVFLGVKETRGGTETFQSEIEFDAVRNQLYKLKKGHWHLPIYDLGDLHAGATREDTYFAFQKIHEELLKLNCIIIVLGGTANLAYYQFRSFDSKTHKVNLTC